MVVRLFLTLLLALCVISPASAEEGELLYVQNCSRCHGIEGKGDGPVVVIMKDPKPKNLTEMRAKQWSVNELITVIEQGVSTQNNTRKVMPGFAKFLSRDQMKKIAKYILKDLR